MSRFRARSPVRRASPSPIRSRRDSGRNLRSLSPPPRSTRRRSPSPIRNSSSRRLTEPGRYKRDRDYYTEDKLGRDSRSSMRRGSGGDDYRDRPLGRRRDNGSNSYRERERGDINNTRRGEISTSQRSHRDLRRPDPYHHREDSSRLTRSGGDINNNVGGGRRDNTTTTTGIRYRDDHDRRGDQQMMRRGGPSDADRGGGGGGGDEDTRERYAAFSRTSSFPGGRRRRPRSPEQWLNDRYLNGDGEHKEIEPSTIVEEKEVDRRPKSAKIVIRDLYADNFNDAFEVIKTTENDQNSSSNESKTLHSPELKEKSVDEE